MRPRPPAYLVRLVMSQSRSSRARLADMLLSSLDVHRARPSEGLRALSDSLMSYCGVDVRDGSVRSRRSSLARLAFIYAARGEGYTQEAIGRHVSRNHSTVHWAEHRMRDVLACPEMDMELFRLYRGWRGSMAKEQSNGD